MLRQLFERQDLIDRNRKIVVVVVVVPAEEEKDHYDSVPMTTTMTMLGMMILLFDLFHY